MSKRKSIKAKQLSKLYDLMPFRRKKKTFKSSSKSKKSKEVIDNTKSKQKISTIQSLVLMFKKYKYDGVFKNKKA